MRRSGTHGVLALVLVISACGESAAEDSDPAETAAPSVDDDLEATQRHMGIAEQGKVYALQGDHANALLYYRHAIDLATAQGVPEIFFRHYMEVSVESLEHTGKYAEVLEYTDRAIELYETHDFPEDAISILDLAHLHQRRGAVLLKQGDSPSAAAALREAVAVARHAGREMPLAATLLGFAELGLHVDAERVLSEQIRHQYYSVRPETVQPERAIVLTPDELAALES